MKWPPAKLVLCRPQQHFEHSEQLPPGTHWSETGIRQSKYIHYYTIKISTRVKLSVWHTSAAILETTAPALGSSPVCSIASWRKGTSTNYSLEISIKSAVQPAGNAKWCLRLLPLVSYQSLVSSSCLAGHSSKPHCKAAAMVARPLRCPLQWSAPRLGAAPPERGLPDHFPEVLVLL